MYDLLMLIRHTCLSFLKIGLFKKDEKAKHKKGKYTSLKIMNFTIFYFQSSYGFFLLFNLKFNIRDFFIKVAISLKLYLIIFSTS